MCLLNKFSYIHHLKNTLLQHMNIYHLYVILEPYFHFQ